jgi:methylated-DNA-[protein]-cysteine S-methyltransferase
MKSFYEKVYEVAKKIPKGKVSTYKEIASALNSKAYRAVGSAMNKNPYAPKVPCHRVINSDGRIGGFASGTKNKIKMLKAEGVGVINERIDLKKYFFKLK